MLRIATLLLLLPLVTGCDWLWPQDEDKPDLITPMYVRANLFVGYEQGPVHIGQILYPYGQNVFLANGAFNEFYSVERPDAPGSSTTVKFYWNVASPPPFLLNHVNPLYRPVQIGENYTVYRFIYNRGGDDGNGQSKTQFRRRVRVENGQVVEESDDLATAMVPSGQYKLISKEYIFQGNGTYGLEIGVDSQNDIDEENEGNNGYVERETSNMGAGG